ncbi:ABC transporter permease [Derxia lacustris]|uniref:ABC transporter permease n=1 Tax=Derxia lacustris TaxID=764842 RepID=UPI000A176078|nr:proline/glycine betaine ABC transporter permease [Derxia lacustris]
MADAFIPLGDWVNEATQFVLAHDDGLFEQAGHVIETFTVAVQDGMLGLPVWLLAGVFAVLGLWRVGALFAGFSAACFFLIYGMGLWEQTVVTLAQTLAATVISLLLGVPVGIASAKSKHVAMVIRPVLDFMQTMPAFVYLIPAAMLFGLGIVPGVLSTVVFAMPPAVRLTALGIRQVDHELVEAGLSFGCTPTQLLFKVQLPNALPSIMAGVNQTIMMALSMVIIASMVGAGGLGNEVLASIQRLDIGLGYESGLSVVLLAIILDRITESFGGGGGKRATVGERMKRVFGSGRGSAPVAAPEAPRTAG